MSTRALALFALLVCAGPALARDGGMKAKPEPKPKPLLPLGAPLGRIGDILQDVPQGGLPGEETVVVARFEGCPTPRAVFVSRFLLMGAAVAGEEIQGWLDRQPRVQRRLFGRDKPLVEAVRRAREGRFSEGLACRALKGAKGGYAFPDLSKEGRLTLDRAPAALCKLERGPPGEGGVWLFTRDRKGRARRRNFTGAVALEPAGKGAKDPCLPKLSAALFDDQGRTRLRYHADYNGAVEVELLGDRCRLVRFVYDAKTGRFTARGEVRKGCR